MKKIYNSILLAAIIMTSVMCSKETEQPGEAKEIDTIQASVASQDEKVSFTQGEGTLTLAWESTDKIMIVGNTAAEYSIASFEGHNATFTGEKVEGDSFDIYYPSSYASKAALMGRSYTGQIQDGNANMEHLEYNALIEGAADYHSIAFGKGEGKKLNGVLKLVVKMPTEIDTVSSISITAPSAIFYTTNEADDTKKTNVLSLSFTDGTTVTDHVLTAYIMTSMVDVTIPAETKLVIKVTVPGSASYFQKTIHDDTKAISINGGETLNIDISSATTMTRKLAGEGTQENPYELWCKEDINAMTYKTDTTYFIMMDDIDMGEEDRSPLDSDGAHKIVFNGNNHTLSNFTISDKKYASFFGILNGRCYDMTFDNISVSQPNTRTGSGHSCAVVAGYLGNANGSIAGKLSNITIKNSTVTNNYVGPCAIAVGTLGCGYINNITIDSTCTATLNLKTDAVGTNVSSLGGVIGYINYANRSVKKCVCNATVNNITDSYIGNQVSTGGVIGRAGAIAGTELISECTFGGSLEYGNSMYTGGIVGLCYKNGTGTTIENCINTGTINTSQTLNKDIHNEVGGIVGYLNKGTVKNCHNTGNIRGYKNIGGIVGDLRTGMSVMQSYNTGNISGTENLGGILGVALASCEISECFNTGNISGNNFMGGIAGYMQSSYKATKKSKVSNCYSSGDLISKGQIVGGIVGELEYNNDVYACYATGTLRRDPLTDAGKGIGRVIGTIVGRACCTTYDSKSDVYKVGWTAAGKNANNAISYVVAWPTSLSAGGSIGQGGSGAIVGHAAANNTYTKCWRRWEVAVSGQTDALYTFLNNGTDTAPCNQGNTTSSITIGVLGSNTNWHPYHGDAAQIGTSGTYYSTVSNVVKNLIGTTYWVSDVWDLSSDFPTLKNCPEN